MKSAEQVLDTHLSELVLKEPSKYLSLEEMKSDPEYGICINAMEEYAAQFKPPPLPESIEAMAKELYPGKTEKAGMNGVITREKRLAFINGVKKMQADSMAFAEWGAKSCCLYTSKSAS